MKAPRHGSTLASPVGLGLAGVACVASTAAHFRWNSLIHSAHGLLCDPALQHAAYSVYRWKLDVALQDHPRPLCYSRPEGDMSCQLA